MLAFIKLPLLILWIGLWYGPVWIAYRFKKIDARDRMVRQCYRGILRIIGIRLKVTGEPSAARPLLLVSNHLSYLDLPLLCSQLPVRFMPKSEIARWLVIGSICRICDAVFVDRRPGKIREVKDTLQNALTGNNVVCLFPEGTTGDGLHMLPFKSGFFQLAEEGALTVQPVAITYTHIRRLPLDRTDWPSIAWYGDMELVPHLMHLLTLGSINAELTFLPPVTHGDRKALANHCHSVIKEALERSVKA